MSEDREYTLFWRTGDREIIRGSDASDAIKRAGYGGGALRALDFYAAGDCTDYIWNTEARNWDMTPEYRERLSHMQGLS